MNIQIKISLKEFCITKVMKLILLFTLRPSQILPIIKISENISKTTDYSNVYARK